jgi:prepilin-type processing-associated H-X9-DG protein
MQANPVEQFSCPSDPYHKKSRLYSYTHPITTYFGVRGIGMPNKMGTASTGDPDAEGILYWRSNVKPQHVTDGLSSTLLVGEHGHVHRTDAFFGSWYSTVNEDMGYDIKATSVVWGVAPSSSFMVTSEDWGGGFSCPIPINYRKPFIPVNNCNYDSFWSYHQSGCNFAFADGSVRFIPYSASSVMPALATRNRGDSIEELP